MASFSGAPAPEENEEAFDRYNRYLMPGYPLDHPLYPGASGSRQLKPEKDALVPWTRVSTIAGSLSANKQIEDWRARLTVKGVGIRPDLYALAAALPLDDKAGLQRVATQALEAAGGSVRANLGTAIHQFADWADTGEDIPVPDPWKRDVEAYQEEMDKHDVQLIPGLSELRVVNPRWADGGAAGCGGRFDRIVMYEGRPTVGDMKTGTDPLRYGASKIAIQLWLYATAWAIWDGKVFKNLPKDLRTDVALVFHVQPGTGICEIHELPLDGCEEAVQTAMAVRAWRRENRMTKMLGVEPEVKKPKTKAKKAVEDQPPFTPDDSDAEGRPGRVELVSEPGWGAKTPVVMDGTGKKPVAPLAGPGQMGCSVCRRTGHRKGSPKCLGENDPVFSSPSVTSEEIDQEISDGDHDTRADAKAALLDKSSGSVPDGDGIPTDDDPFDQGEDEPETQEVDWEERINDCESKAQLQALRRQAKELGVWNNDLLAKMIARLDQVKPK